MKAFLGTEPWSKSGCPTNGRCFVVRFDGLCQECSSFGSMSIILDGGSRTGREIGDCIFTLSSRGYVAEAMARVTRGREGIVGINRDAISVAGLHAVWVLGERADIASWAVWRRLLATSESICPKCAESIGQEEAGGYEWSRVHEELWIPYVSLGKRRSGQSWAQVAEKIVPSSGSFSSGQVSVTLLEEALAFHT